MEPGREEQKALGPGAEQKPRRFRIIKLEDRIAPAKGGGTNGANCYTHKCTVGCATLVCTGGLMCTHACW